MTYTATDSDGDTSALSFTIVVVDGLSFGAYSVVALSFAQATEIVPVTLPSAVGGSGTLSYALTPNVPGLLFDNATRELSGTPTTAGTWSMTYQVTDGAGDTASLDFTIGVLGFASELIPDLPVLPDLSGEVDVAIAGAVLLQATGGDGALVYSLEPEVPGLAFDPASRTLSGTPTKAGEYPMTYTVTDAQGTVVALPFTITVLPSFRGTWRLTDRWEDDLVATDTLTFTKERYIFHRAVYRDGVFEWRWTKSGTWELSGNGTIIRVREEDRDDEDATPRIEIRTPKSYRWENDSRDRLFMNEWDWDEADWIAEYERVLNPVPSPPIGAWTIVRFETRVDDEWTETTTMSINADGTFAYSTAYDNGWPTQTITASWTLDEDNYYLNLSGAVDDDGEMRDDWTRIAYAPTHVIDELAVSEVWQESPTSRWYRTYGGYFDVYTRQ